MTELGVEWCETKCLHGQFYICESNGLNRLVGENWCSSLQFWSSGWNEKKVYKFKSSRYSSSIENIPNFKHAYANFKVPKGTCSLQWRHNGLDGISNHQPHQCLLSRLFGRRSKKTSKFRVTGLCAGNSPETGEFPAQMASNAENDSSWWRHQYRDQRWGLIN